MPGGAGLARCAAVAAAVAAPAAAAPCEDGRWRSLHDVLDRASRETAYREAVVEGFHELQQSNFAWYRENYQDCVEGFVSLVLYLSLHNAVRQKTLLDLADHAARELNPLALRAGLSSWPLFGLEGQLTACWQNGQRAAPLPTEPWRSAPCAHPAPARISPLLAAMTAGGAGITSMTIARGLRPGSLLVDAGVFDGTDWSLAGVLAGATVVGFEPLLKNRRLFESRFPAALGEASPQVRADGCRAHTLLDVAPGRGAPQVPWHEVPSPGAGGAAACGGALGHAYVLGAAVGERVRELSMTTRYDYSSISDQGYLKGPRDMDLEQVAMTTLDHVFGEYLAVNGSAPAPAVDVLKLDVEGYEMGALRGAEGLLSQGLVHYLVVEFHPGMLGTTGTDPQGLLEFLQHYCFVCHSLKIDRPHTFSEFVARYTASADVLPTQGLGALEDLICENPW